MMKTYLITFVALLAINLSNAQQSCCQMADKAAEKKTENTVAFASLADETDFRNAHKLPASYRLENPAGQMIEFETADGKRGKAYAVMAAEESKQYVLMIHEWWGLNDHIKEEADRLAKELGHVNVMALDLYDGQVATTRENAAKYMQSVTTDRAQAIIQGAISKAGESARIATIGWCFGGGWSLRASLLAGDQAAGCVMYYGMPIRDAEQLKGLQADVLGIFASRDGWITPEVVEEFENSLEEAGKESSIHMFDADHAFANPSRDVYDKEDAEKAYALSLAFLRERLK
jgi:carboxymethylenebutenolidase